MTVNYGSLGSSDSSYAVYTTTYDPSLLVPIERALIRDQWGIDSSEFYGWDVWNGHESTFLLDNGRPIAGTLRIKYASDTPNIVESKSMKLYLNSFDMCKMGDTIDSASFNYCAQIKYDLSKIVNGVVDVNFLSSNDYRNQQNKLAPYMSEFVDIDTLFELFSDFEDSSFDDYTGQKDYLITDYSILRANYSTNVLRSRCRKTQQKDTGTALYSHTNSSHKTITPLSFLKQVVSLREVNEFHEGCCEILISKMIKAIDPADSLFVILLYSRRGSLDINPIRIKKGTSFHNYAIFDQILNVEQFQPKTQGQ